MIGLLLVVILGIAVGVIKGSFWIGVAVAITVYFSFLLLALLFGALCLIAGLALAKG